MEKWDFITIPIMRLNRCGRSDADKCRDGLREPHTTAPRKLWRNVKLKKKRKAPNITMSYIKLDYDQNKFISSPTK